MDDAAPSCYRHPQHTTRIRCQRCDRPICPECMHEGPVGFQCRECIAQAARETRQARLPYGGSRSENPRATSIVLICINVAIWALVLATGAVRSALLDWLALMPYGRCALDATDHFYVHPEACAASGMDWVSGVATGAWWQVLTSGFTHESPIHLGFNMLVLWMMGPQVEQVLGRARFLTTYVVSLLGGSAAVVLLGEGYTQTIGASGAIYGLLGVFLVLAFKHRGDTRQILVWLGINLAFSFLVARSSWQSHVGGLVVGLAVAAAIVLLGKRIRERQQWPLLAGIVVVIVVGIVIGALLRTPQG